MDKTLKLDRCPFCGRKDNLKPVEDLEQGSKFGAIRCNECGCRGPEVRTGYNPVEKWAEAAAEEWNLRV